jgi:type II secretory pathway pseudopilin PulG
MQNRRADAVSCGGFSMRRRNSGFTFVEIIVVLGIIIMLAGLLFPLVGRFKEAGKRTQCLNNLRSLTQAWIAYAGDNDRHICSSGAGPTGWITRAPDPKHIGPVKNGKLYPYLNSIDPYRCPDDLSDPKFSPISYSINGLLNGPIGNPFTYTRLEDIQSPSATFVFIEGGSGGTYVTVLYPNPPVLRLNSWPGQNHKGAKAYAEGSAISFADGHAIFWTYADTRTGNFAESYEAGLNGPRYTNGQPTPANLFAFDTNSPDVFQLMAWSGGPLPPNPPKMYDPTQPWP